MSKNIEKRIESETATHSVPAIFVQVPDIGYGVPGIELFCNKPNHPDCLQELRKAIKSGGRIVPRTMWWKDLVKRLDI